MTYIGILLFASPLFCSSTLELLSIQLHFLPHSNSLGFQHTLTSGGGMGKERKRKEKVISLCFNLQQTFSAS